MSITTELTHEDIYPVARPYLPPGEIAINEQRYAAELVENDRSIP